MVGNNEPISKNPPSKRWQVGFIQTVESVEYEAFYNNGWGRKVLAGKTRDAADDTIDAPWYGPPGSTSEPVIVADAVKNHPAHSDDPEISLSVAHPDASCRQLEAVTMKGKFHIWLIARDPMEVLDVNHLRFLWHATVTFDRRWDLPFGKDPFLLPEWKATGTQTKTNIDLGQGPQTPILDKPIANSQLVFGTHKKGPACPKN
jgi:hypothetical protein